MGAFISLAFRVSGRVENLSKLDAAFEELAKNDAATRT